MASTLATGDASAWTVDRQLLDVICSDADLLAAEFDAIIAAEWPTPPSGSAGQGAAGGHPRNGATRRAAGAVRGPVSRVQHLAIGEWVRQRSPPFRCLSSIEQKGR